MTTLSAVIVARDESRSIARCLDSLRGHVDELLVLDTGSVDDTVAIARGCGARVVHFTWVDDFAAARNAALEAATGDWCLIVDADEWLAAGAEELARLRGGGTPTAPGAVGQLNEQSSGQRGMSWIPRLLPRGVRYEGRIHEQPVLTTPAIRTGIRLGHDGYLREQLAAKSERNRVLLEAALEADPDDVYLRYQLGKDHEVHRRYPQAVQHYDLAYAAAPPETSWRHDLVIRHLFALSQVGRTGDALEIADVELPRWTHSADFFFVVGDLLLSHAVENPTQAEQLLVLAQDAWTRCLELGDTLDLPGAVAGRGSHLAEHNLQVLRGEI